MTSPNNLSSVDWVPVKWLEMFAIKSQLSNGARVNSQRGIVGNNEEVWSTVLEGGQKGPKAGPHNHHHCLMGPMFRNKNCSPTKASSNWSIGARI